MKKDNCSDVAEFEGTTKQQMRNLTDLMTEVRKDISMIKKWMYMMGGGIMVMGISNLPEIAKVLAGGIK